MLKNVNVIQIDNIAVLVSSKEELLFAKKNIIPPRKKDLIDIEELEKLIDNENKKENNKKSDPMFDGLLERPVHKMTPREKIDYIWAQMEFKYKIRNRKIIK